jgi:putative membrane protein
MRKIIFILATVFAVSACTPKEKEKDSNEAAEESNDAKFDNKKDEKDAEFVAETVAGNHAEIQLAQLATQKSNNAQVKEVAKMLEADHSKLLTELEALASTKAISVPSEPEDKAKKTIEDLTKETDVKEFNKDWCKEMVDKHEKTIKNFEDRADKTEDADLKIWITQTLPQLRTHLDKVKACEESIN